jgi:small subunit ribosomal protein S6
LNPYEITFIIRPDLEEEATRAVADAVAERLQAAGGEIIATYPWNPARRRMAYEIRDFGDGFYVTTTFRIAPQELPAVETALRLNDRILRFLIVQATELNIRQSQQRMQQMQAPAQTAPAAPAPAAASTPSTQPAPAAEAEPAVTAAESGETTPAPAAEPAAAVPTETAPAAEAEPATVVTGEAAPPPEAEPAPAGVEPADSAVSSAEVAGQEATSPESAATEVEPAREPDIVAETVTEVPAEEPVASVVAPESTDEAEE